MNDFKSKYGPWALVAGASEGLGAAFAEALAKRSLNLVLVARNSEKLERVASDLRDRYSVKITPVSLDLADHKETSALLKQLNLDIGLLIYNAAFSPIGYFEHIAGEKLSKIVDVNIKSPLLLIKLLSTEMIKRGKGGIVLMSSLAGIQGSPKIATYAASKAFNTILAEGLWMEWKETGIDVLACNAGAIRTPGYQQAQNKKEAPGTLDANVVAEKTLKALGKGPSYTPGFTNRLARFLLSRILPRKLAILIMNNNTKDLS